MDEWIRQTKEDSPPPNHKINVYLSYITVIHST